MSMQQQALGLEDLRKLYEAHVLFERRRDSDRRVQIAYPRGGRREADTLRVTAYRRSVALADPFRWQRVVRGWVASVLIPLLLGALVAVVARQIIRMFG